MTGSFSDHGRIMLESAPQTFHPFAADFSYRFWTAIMRGRRSIW